MGADKLPCGVGAMKIKKEDLDDLYTCTECYKVYYTLGAAIECCKRRRN